MKPPASNIPTTTLDKPPHTSLPVPLRLALIGPVPPPAGGMAGQTQQLHDLLRQENIQVELLPTNPPYPARWIEPLKGLRALIRLGMTLPRLWRAAGRNQVFHIMANSGWSWHLFAAPAVWIGAWRGVRVIVNYRGGEAESFFQRSWRWIYPTLRRCDAVAVPSAFLQQVFARFGQATTIIPNIIDLQRFACDPLNSRLIPTPPRVIIPRNLEPIYGIATAVHAFAQVLKKIPDAQLSIAGSGPALHQLQQLTQNLGIAAHVHFVGRLSRDEMVAFYHSATVMLNPSRVDNMPNSVLEAWACGTPVVSTNVGGIPYIAQHQVTALLVPAEQPDAMAAMLLTLLHQPALQKQLRDNAWQEVQRYTWAHIKPLWLKCYQPDD